MRIATITTTHHNVGDDFAREGIMHLVHEAGGGAAQDVHIHKHLPITSRHNWAWVGIPRLGKGAEQAARHARLQARAPAGRLGTPCF